MQIGIPANMLGFSYIVTALELIALDPDYLNHITKGLYVDVAKKCSSTAARVERNIRHAIEIGFLKGDLEEIEYDRGRGGEFRRTGGHRGRTS